MKKVYYFLTFIFLFLICNRVDAIVCSYGTKSDDNAEWQRKFTLNVEAYNKIYVDLSKSPEFSVVDEESEESNEKDCIYFRFVDVDATPDNIYKLYLALYNDSSMYDDIKNDCVREKQKLNNNKNDYSDECGCPPVLRYYYMKESFGHSIYHWQLYNDDLNKPELNDDSVAVNDKDSIADGYMIEERYKDQNIDNLITNGCPTYYYTMRRMKDSLRENGCENNHQFDLEYTALEEKCEALRGTSTYTDESGTPKACQKSCTNLYDEVEQNIANICGTEYKGKYCGSLGNKIVNWIFKIIRMIRYALPAVVIILTILDYIKALAADDEGEVKKVNKRFMYRLIAVALLFIVPFILDFIFKIFDIPGFNSSNPFCAK